jgi:hypothetical protein
MKRKIKLNIPSYFWILLEHVWKSGYFKGFFGVFGISKIFSACSKTYFA